MRVSIPRFKVIGGRKLGDVKEVMLVFYMRYINDKLQRFYYEKVILMNGFWPAMVIWVLPKTKI